MTDSGHSSAATINRAIIARRWQFAMNYLEFFRELSVELFVFTCSRLSPEHDMPVHLDIPFLDGRMGKMTMPRKGLLVLAVLFGLSTIRPAVGTEPKTTKSKPGRPVATPTKPAQSKIQLVILLDTSGSMNGLINQARARLWKIVNQLATARRDGQAPHLEVALYEYGKNSIPRSKGFLRQIVPLTDDLDRISEELFALKTNGGNEYCGQVIDAATRQLKWSKSNKDLKMIFIAGNEPFSQGSLNYRDACTAAIAKGITVNTIFCGPRAVGVRTGWQHGAQLADGAFLNIDQNRKVAEIATPYDKPLAELSGRVNGTYVMFGASADRKRKSSQLRRLDSLAKKAAPSAAAARAGFKASGQYRRSAWDLSVAVKSGKIKLKDLKPSQLPPAMRKLSLAQQQAYLTKKAAERAAIEAKIRKLSAQRARYIAEQKKKNGSADKPDSFDDAVIKTIRTQGKKKGYQFKQRSAPRSR